MPWTKGKEVKVEILIRKNCSYHELTGLTISMNNSSCEIQISDPLQVEKENKKTFHLSNRENWYELTSVLCSPIKPDLFYRSIRTQKIKKKKYINMCMISAISSSGNFPRKHFFTPSGQVELGIILG